MDEMNESKTRRGRHVVVDAPTFQQTRIHRQPA